MFMQTALVTATLCCWFGAVGPNQSQGAVAWSGEHIQHKPLASERRI